MDLSKELFNKLKEKNDRQTLSYLIETDSDFWNEEKINDLNNIYNEDDLKQFIEEV